MAGGVIHLLYFSKRMNNIEVEGHFGNVNAINFTNLPISRVKKMGDTRQSKLF